MCCLGLGHRGVDDRVTRGHVFGVIVRVRSSANETCSRKETQRIVHYYCCICIKLSPLQVVFGCYVWSHIPVRMTNSREAADVYTLFSLCIPRVLALNYRAWYRYSGCRRWSSTTSQALFRMSAHLPPPPPPVRLADENPTCSVPEC